MQGSAMKIPMVVAHAAQASHAKFYPRGPFASVTIAQWVIESGWGQFVSGKNNYFGIKATQDQIASGNATSRWTHETFHGVYHPIQQWFADYDSIDDCFISHARLLSTSPYYWKARQAATPDEYAMALQGIYATGIPGHPYGEVLIKTMKSNALYAYDSPPAPAAVAPFPLPEVGSPSWVQSSLNAIGSGGLSGEHLVVDGVLGMDTRFAVRKFQRMHGLVVDGDAGPLTCAELSKAVAAAAKST